MNIQNTSLTDSMPAPSEPGDTLSSDDEAVSLLQIDRQMHLSQPKGFLYTS